MSIFLVINFHFKIILHVFFEDIRIISYVTSISESFPQLLFAPAWYFVKLEVEFSLVDVRRGSFGAGIPNI